MEWDETDWEHPVAIAHYNFFLGANDALYWPTDGNDPAAKMKGFRAHCYVLTGSDPREDRRLLQQEECGEMDIQGGGPQTGARAPQKPF